MGEPSSHDHQLQCWEADGAPEREDGAQSMLGAVVKMGLEPDPGSSLVNLKVTLPL